MKIGFIGLGRMGSAMAANLLKAGHDVTVFNRSPEKLRPLIELGAREAASIADACRGELVVTMLADDTAVADVAFSERRHRQRPPEGCDPPFHEHYQRRTVEKTD